MPRRGIPYGVQMMQQEYEVERIDSSRYDPNLRTQVFNVKWKGYKEIYNTWEPAWNLENSKELLQDYLEREKQSQKTRSNNRSKDDADFQVEDAFVDSDENQDQDEDEDDDDDEDEVEVEEECLNAPQKKSSNRNKVVIQDLNDDDDGDENYVPSNNCISKVRRPISKRRNASAIISQSTTVPSTSNNLNASTHSRRKLIPPRVLVAKAIKQRKLVSLAQSSGSPDKTIKEEGNHLISKGYNGDQIFFSDSISPIRSNQSDSQQQDSGQRYLEVACPGENRQLPSNSKNSLVNSLGFGNRIMIPSVKSRSKLQQQLVKSNLTPIKNARKGFDSEFSSQPYVTKLNHLEQEMRRKSALKQAKMLAEAAVEAQRADSIPSVADTTPSQPSSSNNEYEQPTNVFEIKSQLASASNYEDLDAAVAVSTLSENESTAAVGNEGIQDEFCQILENKNSFSYNLIHVIKNHITGEYRFHIQVDKILQQYQVNSSNTEEQQQQSSIVILSTIQETLQFVDSISIINHLLKYVQ